MGYWVSARNVGRLWLVIGVEHVNELEARIRVLWLGEGASTES